MALKDYLQDIEERNNQEKKRQEYINARLPKARENAVERDAIEYYDEICKSIARGIDLNDKKLLNNHIFIQEYIEIEISSEYDNYPNEIKSERLYDFEYKQGFNSFKCWMSYKNDLLNNLFEEIQKLCKQDGIIIEPFCIMIDTGYSFGKQTFHALDEKIRLKWRAQIGGGRPWDYAKVVLKYKYLHNT